MRNWRVGAVTGVMVLAGLSAACGGDDTAAEDTTVSLMEGVDLGTGSGREREMRTGTGRAGQRRELQAELVLIVDQAIADRRVVLEHAAQAEGAQRRVIETA